ncbi:MAG: PLDc N-terminal domain-containing protein [Gemmatimonadaceae bacterium]
MMIQVPPAESLLAGGTTWPLWFACAWIVLGVSALISIWMGTRHGKPAKLVWTGIVVFVPVLGGLGWFVLGRERRRNPRP